MELCLLLKADGPDCGKRQRKLPGHPGWEAELIEGVQLFFELFGRGARVNKGILLFEITVDALAEAVQDVLDGNMTGTVLNDDVGQATAAAEATKLYVEGSKVEQYYWVDYVKVTKDNASEYVK